MIRFVEFILSAKEGRIDLMEELLRNGADVEAKDKVLNRQY